MLRAKSKLNQQNRNYERTIYKQHVQELNQKLHDLTQAIEMLKKVFLLVSLYVYTIIKTYIFVRIHKNNCMYTQL